MEISLQERKNLHKLCFGDSDLITDAYFKAFWHGINATDIIENGKLVATMYFKRYFLRAGLSVIPYDFITSLCVRPDARLRGLATQLLSKYFSVSAAPFVVLHPFNVNFYEKQGFVPFNYFTPDTGKATGNVVCSERVLNPQRIFSFVKATEKALSLPDRGAAVLKTAETRYNEVLLELLDGAEFQLLTKNGDFVGYTLLKDNEITEYQLLGNSHLNDVADYKNFKFFHTGFQGAVYNMSRAVDIEALLKTISYNAANQTKIDFYVTDSRIPRNNGAYRIVAESNRCKAILRLQNDSGLPHISAEELTLAALGQPRKLPAEASGIKSYFFEYGIPDLSQY